MRFHAFGVKNCLTPVFFSPVEQLYILADEEFCLSVTYVWILSFYQPLLLLDNSSACGTI